MALVTIAISAFAAASCSLFVGLDGLSDGNASDASTTDSDARIANDASTLSDVHLDAPPCVPVVRVQSAHLVFEGVDGSTGQTLTLPLPGLELDNDFLVVGLNYFDCGSVVSITDTAGNSYKNLIPAAGSSDDGRGVLETWGAANVVRAPSNVITVQFATACTDQNLKVVEYEGIDAFDPVEATTMQLAAPDAAPDAALTASSAALLFAHSADQHTCMGPGAGWSTVFIDDWATIAEDLLAPEGGTFIASERPSSDDNWGIQAVALRACKSP